MSVAHDPIGTEPAGAARRGGTRAWRIGGLVVAALTIAYGSITLADLALHETSVQTATFEPVSTIEIDTDGTVRVLADPTATEITVTTRVEHGLREPDHDAAVADGRLSLTGRCPAVVGQWCVVSYTVITPANVAVHARSGADDVVVEGVDGDVVATSDAGDVTVRDLGGAARLSSDAGDVRADDMRSHDVHASSSAGSVRVSMSIAPDAVVARSDADTVLVEVPDDGTAYVVEASSDAGDTRVDVPTVAAGAADASHTIDASSDADDVTIRLRAG